MCKYTYESLYEVNVFPWSSLRAYVLLCYMKSEESTSGIKRNGQTGTDFKEIDHSSQNKLILCTEFYIYDLTIENFYKIHFE